LLVADVHVWSLAHAAVPHLHAAASFADPSVFTQSFIHALSALLHYSSFLQFDVPQAHRVTVDFAELSTAAHAATAVHVLLELLQSWLAVHAAVPHLHAAELAAESSVVVQSAMHVLSALLQYSSFLHVAVPHVHRGVVDFADWSVAAHADTAVHVLLELLQLWLAVHAAVPHLHAAVFFTVSSVLAQSAMHVLSELLH